MLVLVCCSIYQTHGNVLNVSLVKVKIQAYNNTLEHVGFEALTPVVMKT
jgi:hypothetical protein